MTENKLIQFFNLLNEYRSVGIYAEVREKLDVTLMKQKSLSKNTLENIIKPYETFVQDYELIEHPTHYHIGIEMKILGKEYFYEFKKDKTSSNSDKDKTSSKPEKLLFY